MHSGVGALTRLRPRGWRLLPYRSAPLSGTAIVAGQETEAPPVRLAVNARGWHAVSIGAWRLKCWYFGLHDDAGAAQLLVRFAGDPTFSILHLPTQPFPRDPIADWHKHTGGEELSECFWQVAELNGADLEFAQAQWLETTYDGAEHTRCAMASVAYVKLVPLTEAEVRRFTAERTAPALPLYGHDDVVMARSSTPEELRRHIIGYADTDFTRIYWEGAMGDLAYYFRTRYRTPEAPGREDFLHVSGRDEAACYRRWRAAATIPCGSAEQTATWAWSSTPATGWAAFTCRRRTTTTITATACTPATRSGAGATAPATRARCCRSPIRRCAATWWRCSGR